MVGAKVRKKPVRKPLSRDKVVVKAIQLANRHGADWLSMRKLAAGLNVEAMSLYNHVENKDDVLDAMINEVVALFPLPVPGKPWKKELKRSVVATHAVLLEHPWASNLLLSRVVVGEAMLSYSNACYGCFVEAGFSYPLADHAWNAISNHLYGFTLAELNSPIDQEEFAVAAEQYLPMVSADDYPYIHAMMLLIKSKKHSGINNFEFGLDLILDGLEQLLDR